jgi:hypothetical protein
MSEVERIQKRLAERFGKPPQYISPAGKAVLFREYLEAFLKEAQEELVCEWRSVAEPPESSDGHYVLVTIAHPKNQKRNVTDARFEDDVWYWDSGDRSGQFPDNGWDVVAWMPKPKAYCGGKIKEIE